MKLLLTTVVQVLFFIAMARIADAAVHWLHLPVPGSIVGIALLFALLKLNVIRLRWIEQGSRWLLGEMLLFFIPASVGIIKYKSLIINDGLLITLIILCSTLIVMASTGFIGERLAGRKGGSAV